MSPDPVPTAEQVRPLIAEFEAHPPEWEEIAELHPHGEWESSLTLIDLVPMWWPQLNPETREPLPPPKRQRWFLEVLGEQLQPARAIVLNGERRSQRLMIAESLLRIQSDFDLSDLPTPDWL
jgi:hypothetical protein